jgi:hypothetical protein
MDDLFGGELVFRWRKQEAKNSAMYLHLASKLEAWSLYACSGLGVVICHTSFCFATRII